MPRYFLTRLAVEGFRGVNNENDPLDISFRADTVNSVFAVNGIGKSSIFEALCYAIHGTIPKLQLLQAQERPQDYYSNRFHSKNTATILAEFQPDDGAPPVSIRIDRDAGGNRTVTSPSGHPDPEEFLATLKAAFALLDYRTFARFIEESPLERGRAFSALLGLAEYSDCRQALQAASDSRALNTDLEIKVLTTTVSAAQKAAQQTLVTLRSSYENVTGKPLEDIDKLDECAAEVTAALGNVDLLKPLFMGKTLDEIDFENIKTAIKTAEGGGKRRELEETMGSIAALEALAVHDLATIAAEQEKISTLGRGLISAQPESDGSDLDHGQEVGSELFVAGGDAAELLELVEGAFDTISQSIQRFAESVPGLRAFSVGDDRDGIALLDQVTDPFGAIGLVGDQETVGRQVRQHGAGGHTVVCLAGAEVVADRQAGNVRHGVDLRGQSTTGTTHATIRTPLFAPAACW